MPFPLEERFILLAEEKINGSLPHYYREKIKESNGGDIEALGDSWLLYPIADTSDKKRLKRTCNNIVTETESARKWYGFPEDVIAVGENGRGDRLILRRQSRSKFGEEIFVWDHETLEVKSVAKNFDKLNCSA